MSKGRDPRQAEYERRRRVWRGLVTDHEPAEAPREGDEAWIRSGYAPVEAEER